MIKVTRSAIIDAPIEAVWAVLRDFNSHWAWHPVVGESQIENGERADRVGCVRNFFLKDGNHIREQLLALSDRDHVSTYCILDATVPLQRYVATVKLSPVTDGDRTFWHWQSTFETPPGQEQTLAKMVGEGVYEAGFAGLREFLRRGGGDQGVAPPVRTPAAGPLAAGRTGPDRAAAIIVERFGGPEVLVSRTTDVPAPGPGEATIRQTAIGVNYIDVYVRKGLFRLIEPPAIPGMEAAGVVERVGSGVSDIRPGDRVAYACPPGGGYASRRTMPADRLVLLPDDIDDASAATLMLKGMSAECLLHRVHRLQPGETVLVHAAAGGLGLMLCSWARAIGARVLGTVSSEDKARAAQMAGCESVIVTRDYRFSTRVRELTAGRGVDLVLDGLGQAASQENLDCLASCGHWISYGQASGPLGPVDPAVLEARSLTLSRPVVFHYTSERARLLEIAGRVFDAWRRGWIRTGSINRFALASAADAHRALESRQTIGPIVLLP
jgi:NADPH:quinone reductase